MEQNIDMFRNEYLLYLAGAHEPDLFEQEKRILYYNKFADLSHFLFLEDKEKDKNEQDAMEYYIVSNLYLLRSSVKVLKNEYPECFAMPIMRASVKIGRNESCPCGSGRKYKKCCGRN